MNFNPLSFDIISVVYGLISINTILRLIKNRRAFRDDTVTAEDRDLAVRIAVFLLVPAGVLLHELGHALATWQLGGRVIEFQWRVFWGYIIPAGNFSPLEDWWISLSGNIVSIALGLVVIPLIPFVRKQILKHLLYVFANCQLVYALIFYPIFSFSGFEGDWARIYDFSLKPYAQLTFAAHILLLLALWLFNKRYGSFNI
ncbi:MAG: hypothetical protein AB1500_01080 [Bacillota bacterium]